MSFNKHYYGDDNPSPLRKSLIHITYVIMFFSFYGAWADFVPSEGTYIFSRYAAFGVGGLVTAWVYYFWYKNGFPLRHKKAGQLHKAGLVVLLPFFFVFVFWMSFSQGIPSLVTRLSGESHSVFADMVKDEHRSSKACDYRLIGDVLERAFPDYICIKKDSFHSYPNHVRIKLSGFITGLGFYIVTATEELHSSEQ